MVASALTILTLAFERYIMVEAPLQSQEYLIHSHLIKTGHCLPMADFPVRGTAFFTE